MNSTADTTTTFWDQRFRQHGHTGWADPTIYAFDQLERLALVKAVVSAKLSVTGAALDFGCGSGDFSKMLLQLGFSICGYDPFVAPAIQSNEFVYAKTYSQISMKNHEASLVLSITTLDHILDEGELRKALNVIRASLKADGFLFILEYALDSEIERSKFNLKNGYQSFRTLMQWESLLHQTGFRIEKVTPAPHPMLNPSKGYQAYSRTLLVRLRRRCANFPLVRFWFDPLLQIAASNALRKYPNDLNSTATSPLKLIQCSPVTPN